MKIAKAVIATPVSVHINTTNASKSQWARIVNSQGKTLHTGQPKYIKGIAKKKFNLSLMW